MPEATETQQRNITLFAERRNYTGTPNFTAMSKKTEGAGHGKLTTLDEELGNFMSTNEFEPTSSEYSYTLKLIH